ncbi:MAG: hypothetical protein PUC41_09415 [Oscillospiraceae bacterium]|nr:hypothetical protein [Oscillospiraceae bacterium]
MDIKAKIDELVAKIKSDDALQAEFKENPVKALEKLTGKDLPDDKIEAVIDGIKAKLAAGDAAEKLGGLFDKFKK